VLGAARIDNSTISGNTVMADHMMLGPLGQGGAAGGVFATGYGSTTIDHSTIAFNKVVNAPAGNFQFSGGVTGFNYNGTTNTFEANVAVRNTIIARNEYNLAEPDVTGSFQSQGHNLIGVLGASATGFVASDLSGTDAAPLDPRLRPLRHNGGPTRTHALSRRSPAINAGDNTDAPPTDQRGRDRIVGGTIDIGSFEARRSRDDYDDDGAPSSAGANLGGLGAPPGLLIVNLGPAPGQETGVGDNGSPFLAAPAGTTLPQGAFTERVSLPPGGVDAAPSPTSFAQLDRAVRPARSGDADLGEPPFLVFASPVTQGGS
jgi:hypothetical protein